MRWKVVKFFQEIDFGAQLAECGLVDLTPRLEYLTLLVHAVLTPTTMHLDNSNP